MTIMLNFQSEKVNPYQYLFQIFFRPMSFNFDNMQTGLQQQLNLLKYLEENHN